jgi:hypothetical protein
MTTIIWHKDLQLDPMDVSDELIIKIDWSDKLGTDVIDLASHKTQAGITVEDYANTDTIQYLRIHTPTAEGFYKITAVIDTPTPQHFERSFTVPVEEL